MPVTTPDNLLYPDENTQIAPLNVLLANMQNSVQNAITDIREGVKPSTISDTGWTLAGLNANAPAFTGMSDSQGRTTSIQGGMRRWGPMVELRFRVTKGSGAITADANGNIGDAVVATISNTSFRPSGTVYALFDYGPGRGSGAARIATDGSIAITDFYPGKKIEAGYQIQIDATYFVG